MEEEYDLRIAEMKKIVDSKQDPEAQKREEWEVYKKQLADGFQYISGFTFEKKTFCQGLFTMVMPVDLFQGEIQEENVTLFRSASEDFVLVVRTEMSEEIPDMEKIKSDYVSQMRDSGQQTKIVASGDILAEIGKVFYFIAMHSMPDCDLCDFISVFTIQGRIVMMDFNFPEKKYRLWRAVIRKLSSTIAG